MFQLMPPVFIKENKKKLAKTCLLKTDIAAGMSWEAKIVKENSHFFICDGEWPKFVAHHKLKLGDILLFFLVDKSTFHILPYGQKTCKNLCRRQLFEELSSSSEEEEECDVGIRLSRKSKKVKTEPKELPGNILCVWDIFICFQFVCRCMRVDADLITSTPQENT